MDASDTAVPGPARQGERSMGSSIGSCSSTSSSRPTASCAQGMTPGRRAPRRCARSAASSACARNAATRAGDVVGRYARRGTSRGACACVRRQPGYALAVIGTLGLGIGANTAMFSVINGVLLKPLPYADGERLVLVRQSAPLAGQDEVGVSIRELYDYREQLTDFCGLVEFHQMSFDLIERGEPDRVDTGVVSANFFDVLGIQPMLGRSFVAADEGHGAEAVLILSHWYWQSRFGGDPHIVGHVFQMNDRPHTVVGVLPPCRSIRASATSTCRHRPARSAREARSGWGRTGARSAGCACSAG